MPAANVSIQLFNRLRKLANNYDRWKLLLRRDRGEVHQNINLGLCTPPKLSSLLPNAPNSSPAPDLQHHSSSYWSLSLNSHWLVIKINQFRRKGKLHRFCIAQHYLRWQLISLDRWASSVLSRKVSSFLSCQCIPYKISFSGKQNFI